MWPNDAEAVIAEYENAAATGYASRWHLSDEKPDPAMWDKSNFGNNHKGIALRSSYALLRAELGSLIAESGDGPLHIREVRYIDHTHEFVPEGQTLEVAFSVRNQKELRVFLTTTWASAAEASILFMLRAFAISQATLTESDSDLCPSRVIAAGSSRCLSSRT